MYRHAVKVGLEGVVGKKADSQYIAGRRREWLKSRPAGFHDGWERPLARRSIALIAINGGADQIRFDFGVFPEFRGRSLQSLLYELQGTERADARDLEPALKASLEMQKIFAEALNALSDGHGSEQQPDTPERERIERLLQEFSSERWHR
jgi:ATP-dependent DNA ligase